MDIAIEVINLAKEFAQRRSLFPFSKRITAALNNINFQVKKGELFALIGPNGAGKTTLIKILTCLIHPTRGTAKIMGADILREEKKVKSLIGLVSGDERSLYWRLTGRQNLYFFASLYNLSPSLSKFRIEKLLDLLKIKEPDKRFGEYSQGTKQKLAIARSLLHNPEVIFMDEPTKSLDPISAYRIRKFVKEELVNKEGKTLVFATHNLEEAEYLANTIAVMDKGKIKICQRLDSLHKEFGKIKILVEKLFYATEAKV